MGNSDGAFFEVRLLPTGCGLVTVAVSGEIAITTAPLLREELLYAIDAGARNVVIDVTKVAFIDSTGISALTVAYKRLLGVRGTLEVHNASPAVRKPLDVTGVSQVIRTTTLEESPPPWEADSAPPAA